MQINSMDAMSRPVEMSFERVAQAEPVQVKQETKAEQKQLEKQQYTPQPQISDNLVKLAVDKANKQMKARSSSLEFSVHERLHEMIVKVVDSETKEVIREIPSEKILDMVANMLEMAGILVDESI